ncbi:Uu.00g079090.m01.CDS01 [Anthostomella pinea]|uniref:Uu.00g079090.m01.CDS01 n=1 Tax=Anthostomella pinea TaxID=933095 RepID=A0AAI8YJB4_9PEZI|nr:Uu.00g079090.m01.CDS01 [Anthostomella pinea]
MQELIASSRVNFYDSKWNYFGSKTQLSSILSWITTINSSVLKGGALNEVLMGRRMSWASSRQTTRVEDIAYCLLGIFDINMPLLYGEGTKAFTRLQEEIIRSSHDLSIFAWTAYAADKRAFRGLWASSPAEFRVCHTLVKPSFKWVDGGEYTMTSRGLRTTGMIRIGRGAAGEAGSYFLPLNCVDARQTKHIRFEKAVFGQDSLGSRRVFGGKFDATAIYICCKESADLEATVVNSRTDAIKIEFSEDMFVCQRPHYWGRRKIKLTGGNDGISIVCVQSNSWPLYGIFSWHDLPADLQRDDLLPGQVEDIRQHSRDRTTTVCSGFMHTVKDEYNKDVDFVESDMQTPFTTLRVSSERLGYSSRGRRKVTKRISSIFNVMQKAKIARRETT